MLLRVPGIGFLDFKANLESGGNLNITFRDPEKGLITKNNNPDYLDEVLKKLSPYQLSRLVNRGIVQI